MLFLRESLLLYFLLQTLVPKPLIVFLPNLIFFRPHNLTLPHAKLSCNNQPNPFTLNTNPSPSPLTESTRSVSENPTHGSLTESSRHVFTESTRTVSSLVGAVILVSKIFGHAIANYVQGVCKMARPNQLLSIQGFGENMISHSSSPLFFAAVRIHRQQLQTPWTIMASGLARCIEVYMVVLGIRVALGFFPNVEWNRQPYSGILDLSDPFLLLFRNIIPPLYDVDMSPTVAFTILAVLVEILTPRLF